MLNKGHLLLKSHFGLRGFLGTSVDLYRSTVLSMLYRWGPLPCPFLQIHPSQMQLSPTLWKPHHDQSFPWPPYWLYYPSSRPFWTHGLRTFPEEHVYVYAPSLDGVCPAQVNRTYCLGDPGDTFAPCVPSVSRVVWSRDAKPYFSKAWTFRRRWRKEVGGLCSIYNGCDILITLLG